MKSKIKHAIQILLSLSLIRSEKDQPIERLEFYRLTFASEATILGASLWFPLLIGRYVLDNIRLEIVVGLYSIFLIGSLSNLIGYEWYVENFREIKNINKARYYFAIVVGFIMTILVGFFSIK